MISSAASVVSVTPVQVVIEAVQFTPDRRAARVQFCGHGVALGLLARSSEYHPTQDDWAALAPADLQAAAPGYWSDTEVKEHLRQYLASQGIVATIVANVDTPTPSADPEDQKPNKSQAIATAAATAAAAATPDENTGA